MDTKVYGSPWGGWRCAHCRALHLFKVKISEPAYHILHDDVEGTLQSPGIPRCARIVVDVLSYDIECVVGVYVGIHAVGVSSK